jgi:hypothetical protein
MERTPHSARLGQLATSLAIVILLAAALPAGAASLRFIASATADTWFDASWRIASEGVVLLRALPALTLEARLARTDLPGWCSHILSLGPVISFTDALYLVALYGLGRDSDGMFSHEGEASLTWETEPITASCGIRADFFPDTGFWYVLPSAGMEVHPLPQFGVFAKLFAGFDSDGAINGSLWSEADYALSPALCARAGFTLGLASTFGYSLIAGLTYRVSPAVSLKYTFRYLSDTVE